MVVTTFLATFAVFLTLLILLLIYARQSELDDVLFWFGLIAIFALWAVSQGYRYLNGNGIYFALFPMLFGFVAAFGSAMIWELYLSGVYEHLTERFKRWRKK
jgi:hypothetical protein